MNITKIKNGSELIKEYFRGFDNIDYHVFLINTTEEVILSDRVNGIKMLDDVYPYVGVWKRYNGKCIKGVVFLEQISNNKHEVDCNGWTHHSYIPNIRKINQSIVAICDHDVGFKLQLSL